MVDRDVFFLFRGKDVGTEENLKKLEYLIRKVFHIRKITEEGITIDEDAGIISPIQIKIDNKDQIKITLSGQAHDNSVQFITDFYNTTEKELIKADYKTIKQHYENGTLYDVDHKKLYESFLKFRKISETVREQTFSKEQIANIKKTLTDEYWFNDYVKSINEFEKLRVINYRLIKKYFNEFFIDSFEQIEGLKQLRVEYFEDGHIAKIAMFFPSNAKTISNEEVGFVSLNPMAIKPFVGEDVGVITNMIHNIAYCDVSVKRREIMFDGLPKSKEPLKQDKGIISWLIRKWLS